MLRTRSILRRLGVTLALVAMALTGTSLASVSAAQAAVASGAGTHAGAPSAHHDFAKKKKHKKKCKKNKKRKSCKKVTKKPVAPVKPATPAAAPYAFASSSFGSQITSPQVALESGPTSLSVLSCTRAVGATRSNSLVGADLNGQVQVGTVQSRQRTLRTSTGTTVNESTATVARVDLGSPLLGITISGLRSTAIASATKAGTLGASSTFEFGSITPRGATPLPAALQQPVDQIEHQLTSSGPIVIPGIGRLSLTPRDVAASSTMAHASGYALQVDLYGADQLPGTSDDSRVLLVHTYARIDKLAKYGAFDAGAWSLDATVADGVADVGRQNFQPMECNGTGGQVHTSSVAGVNLLALNGLDVGAATSRTYGVQNATTRAVNGWDDSTVAGLDLGPIHVEAIRAYAKATMGADGRVTSTYTQSLGSLTVNGEPRALPSPGQSITVPGVAVLSVPTPVRTSSGVQVTGLRLTLLGGSAAQSVVNLATAKVFLNR